MQDLHMSLFHRRTVEEWKKVSTAKLAELAREAEKLSSDFSTIKVEINEYSSMLEIFRMNKSDKLKDNIRTRAENLVVKIEQLKKQLSIAESEIKESRKATERTAKTYKVEFKPTFGFGGFDGLRNGYKTTISEGEQIILGKTSWSHLTLHEKSVIVAPDHLTVKVEDGKAIIEKLRNVNSTVFIKEYEPVSQKDVGLFKTLDVLEFHKRMDTPFIQKVNHELYVFVFVKASATILGSGWTNICVGDISIVPINQD